MRDFSKSCSSQRKKKDKKKQKKKNKKNTRKKEEEHKAFSDTERYKNGRDMGRGKDDFDDDDDDDDSFYAVLGVERPTKKEEGRPAEISLRKRRSNARIREPL